MARLPREYYLGNTVDLARDLLGKTLVRVLNGEPLVCRITETEAYVARCDKACHAYNYRRTPRTETLFLGPGHAYIYFIYGMYHCLNFVTEAQGEPAAVLIRGAAQGENGDIIAKNRFGCNTDQLTAYQRKNLLNGPGKLCRALQLTRQENGLPLSGPELYVEDGPAPAVIHTGKRIGIDDAEEAADFPWRFWLEKEM